MLRRALFFLREKETFYFYFYFISSIYYAVYEHSPREKETFLCRMFYISKRPGRETDHRDIDAY